MENFVREVLKLSILDKHQWWSDILKKLWKTKNKNTTKTALHSHSFCQEVIGYTRYMCIDREDAFRIDVSLLV